jgi:hypothetical protein
MKMGRLPYRTIQWMLSNDLNLPGLQTRIYEQTGKLQISSTGTSTYSPKSIEYRVYDEYRNSGVKVSFSSQTPRSPARIRLTRDTDLDGTFYTKFPEQKLQIGEGTEASVAVGKVLGTLWSNHRDYREEGNVCLPHALLMSVHRLHTPVHDSLTALGYEGRHTPYTGEKAMLVE